MLGALLFAAQLGSFVDPIPGAEARTSLRELAAHYAATIPVTALPAAPLPSASAQKGRAMPAFAIGLAAGSALGFGLGRGSGEGPNLEQFDGFGVTDALITAGAAAIAVKGYALAAKKAPDLCPDPAEPCVIGPGSPHGLDAHVRKHLRFSQPQNRALADSLSYGTVAASLALPLAFQASRPHPIEGREFWMTIESGTLTLAVLQVAKHRVRRARPYVRHCESDCRTDAESTTSQLSFFSGHTALAFSSAVSAGTIASMRSYPHAGWVLGSGLALAATTGYLRIAADRHYFTDVLTGALVGSAIGFAVPKLHGMRPVPPEERAAALARPTPRIAVPLPMTAAQGRLRFFGSLGADGAGLTLSFAP